MACLCGTEEESATCTKTVHDKMDVGDGGAENTTREADLSNGDDETRGLNMRSSTMTMMGMMLYSSLIF